MSHTTPVLYLGQRCPLPLLQMRQPVPKPTVGQIIQGKYELIKVLGEGGMGIVFEAVHTKMRQRVAVKILLPELIGFEEVVERFAREALAAGQLKSRYAAHVRDVDVTESGLPYLVMEFLEGHDLGTELESRLKLPVDEAVGYVLQACLALQEAHQLGIVHRDLKPANLFLARENNTQVVKLLDFGISKVVHDADRLTAADTVMGTVMYMSPEQVRSAKDVDGRSDIWSLGVILYELLCGQPPFLGTTTQIAAAIVSDDPPPMSHFGITPAIELEMIVRSALTRNPSGRPQTVRDFASALFPYAGLYGLGLEAFSQASSKNLIVPMAVFDVLQSEAARTEISSSRSRPNIPTPPQLMTEGTWTGSSESRRQKSKVFISATLAACVLLTMGGAGAVRMRSQSKRAPTAGTSARDIASDDPTPVNVPKSSRPAATPEAAEPVPLPSSAVSPRAGAPAVDDVPTSDSGTHAPATAPLSSASAVGRTAAPVAAKPPPETAASAAPEVLPRYL